MEHRIHFLNEVKTPQHAGTPRSHVLLLLRLERERDEDLLQFLVDEVYGQLLKPITVENLKTINVEDANAQQLLVIFILDARVEGDVDLRARVIVTTPSTRS